MLVNKKISISCGCQNCPCATQSLLEPDIIFVSNCDSVKVKMKCQCRLLKEMVVTEDCSCEGGTGIEKHAVKPNYNPSALGGAALSYSRKL